MLSRMPQSLLTGQLKKSRHIGFGVYIVHSSMFVSKGLPPVATTPAITEKMFEGKFFIFS